ncbi:SDR family oxidoreductase [Comamonadaceae bacterium G21597-S1]|nr:SDR family oxidoreductase [Comamonadaceae bacterium G21597-S1]
MTTPTPSDLPLSGRVALITGANTGIGLVSARELARQGAHLFITCRDARTSQAALQRIRESSGNPHVEALQMDLGDFTSVRTCAQTFLERDLPLHLLVNNAGLAGQRGLTASGFELAFGVNHLGPFLFTQLLLDRIKASAPARIVTVASRAHYRATGLDWDAVRQRTRSRTGLDEYSNSKLANVLFSAELGRRLAGSGVGTYALHPGVVATDVWRAVPWPFRQLMKLGMISTEQGALTTLHCSTADAVANETGLYYDKCQPRTPSALGRDSQLAAELWRRSASWVESHTA